MGWKLSRKIDAKNSIGFEKLVLKNLSSGEYSFEFTGKVWSNPDDKTTTPFPTFRVVRVEDGEVMGECAITCPPKLPQEIKDSAVLFAEQYKILMENGVIAIIPK